MSTNSSIELMNVKGGYDYLPSVLVRRNQVVAILKKHFERFGYLPLETTMLCYHELLSYKYAGGSEILKEVYTLSDQGERALGLRYDLTVPFCKVIGMNQNIPMPFKRYEIGKVFRDGPVKLGRGREFYQCDVDAVGINGQVIEAELMNLAVLAYGEIGIDIEVCYSNRKFLNSMIIASGFLDENCSQVILEIDKLEKIGRKGVKEGILGIAESISEASIDKLLDTLASPIADIKKEFEHNVDAIEGLSELIALEEAITGLGIRDHCRFVPSLARGLEIYTGSVWEVFDKQKRLTSSLGGGGRYDKIITNFMDNGQEYPAVGMSFGLEPICAVLESENKTAPALVDLYVIPLDDRIFSMALANKLRVNDINVLVEMTGRKLKKNFSFADNERIPFVTVIGENEIEAGAINIKNMRTGVSTKFLMEDMVGISKFIKENDDLIG